MAKRKIIWSHRAKNSRYEILKFYVEINTNRKFRQYPIVMFPGYHQRRVGCFGAGNRYFYVDSLGDVHACPFCQHKAGNLLKDNINDLRRILLDRGCHVFKTNRTELH